MVRPPVLAGELSLSCARLTADRVTTLWVKHPLSVNQHGQLSQPSLRGRLNEYVLYVCLLPMAGRTAGPIKTKLGVGTHVDPGSVLVKVKVMCDHLANANKTPYRGPQGPRE